MRSYILDVSQPIMVENELDINDWLILEAIRTETQYHIYRIETTDDTYAKWEGEDILELFPVITIKDSQKIDRRIRQLAGKGFLLQYTEDGRYYSIGEKYNELTHGF